MITLIDSLINQFNSDSNLSYLKDRFYKYIDEFEKINQGKVPFVSIEGSEMNRESVNNMPGADVEKNIFQVSVSFYQKSKDKDILYTGNADHKGIWQMEKDLYESILSDTSIGGIVKDIHLRPNTKTFITTFEEGLFIAKGVMTISFYKNIFR